jgi:hypothetical protein
VVCEVVKVDAAPSVSACGDLHPREDAAICEGVEHISFDVEDRHCFPGTHPLTGSAISSGFLDGGGGKIIATGGAGTRSWRVRQRLAD